MAAKLGVEIIGDAASLKAALGSATAATDRFAADYKVAFAGMSESTLKLAVAQDKLAISTAKYGTGTTGAAAATLAYRRQVESLHASQMAAITSVGRGLTTYVTAPLAVAGYESVKFGVEFQRQMLMVQTQAGASASEVKNLSGQVIDLAGQVGTSPITLAQGLFHLESLGLRGAQAMGALKESALAAGMGIANLEDVTTALGGAVVSGIQGAKNYQQAMATLVATAGVGNMRMEDLAGSMGQVLSSAVNGGVSLRELGAAMAVLTDRGMSADLAATRLRMTFSLMQAPSEKAKKALKDMGINADDLGKMLHQPNGLLNVLTLLHNSMAKVGTVRGSRDILEAFGGGRSGAGVLTLIQSLDSSVSSYQGKLEAIGGAMRRYDENQKAYLESPSFKLHQDLAKIQADLTKFGATLAPIAVEAGRAVAAIADGFAKLPGPVKTELGVIIGLLAVGGPLMLAGAGVVKMIGSMRAAFALLPVTAGPAIAATDAEMATLGTAAASAEVKILSLRTALLGLGALAAIPIVIDVIEKFIKSPSGIGSTPVTSSLGVAPSTDKTAATQGEITRGSDGQYYWHRGGRYYPISPKRAAQLGVQAPDALTRSLGNPNLFTSPAAPSPPAPKVAPLPRLPVTVPTPAAPSKTKTAAAAAKALGFVVPMDLEIAAAKAGTTAIQSDDVKAAKAIKAFAEAAVASGKLRGQALVDAYNQITQENSIIGQQVGQAAQAVKTSSAKLTAGLGLSHDQRVELEQRIAQSEAHGGHIPRGPAALGVPIIIHISGAGDPHAVARKVADELKRRQRGSTISTRGRHGGNALAF